MLLERNKMKRIETLKRKARLVLSLIIINTCLITIPLFAVLDSDVGFGKKFATNVWGYVQLHTLEYNGEEPGIAYLGGLVMFLNEGVRSHNYDGEFRLEILGYSRDEKIPFSGKIEKSGKDGAADLIFKNLSLPVDRTDAPREQEHTMRGTITLRVYHPIGTGKDQWQANHDFDFYHDPIASVGIGPATGDGTDFTRDYLANAGDSWDSLLITDAPYDEVLWYVQAPGEDFPGTYKEVDAGIVGDMTRATMSNTFPAEIDQSGYFTIRAEIWRNDGSGYYKSYNVWVER